MTKKKPIGIILVIAFILFSYMKTNKPSSTEQKRAVAPQVSSKIQSSLENKTITQTKNLIERTPATTGYVNQPSLNWENNLKDSLQAQGGINIKEIKIQKERSLIWMRDENPLHVESVVVTLTNHKKMESTFRALVDSQTGKVLESWDRTIVDSSQIKEDAYRIKLDPRYQ